MSVQARGLWSHVNSTLYSEKLIENTDEDDKIEMAEGYGFKPVFIRENDVRAPGASFGGWVEEDEVIDSLVQVVKLSHLKGVQRIYKAWRIYVDNMDDRIKLLSVGMPMRGRIVSVLPDNPNRPIFSPVSTTRLVVSNVPLSIYDGQIIRKIEKMGCEVLSAWREKVRYKSKLTDCDNGRRIVIVQKLKSDIPKYIDISVYRGQIWYYGKPKETQQKKICSNCKQEGHTSSDCDNEIVCDGCGNEGHRRDVCPLFTDDVQGTDVDEEDDDDMGVDVDEEADEYESVTSEQQNVDDVEESETASVPDNNTNEEESNHGVEKTENTESKTTGKDKKEAKSKKSDKSKKPKTTGKDKQDKKESDKKKQKEQRKKESVANGPMDNFINAAKNMKDVLATPKGKQMDPKSRTPPSASKDEEKIKRDKTNI